MKLARELVTVLSLGVALFGVYLYSPRLCLIIGGGLVFTGCLIGAFTEKRGAANGKPTRTVRTRKKNG